MQSFVFLALGTMPSGFIHLVAGVSKFVRLKAEQYSTVWVKPPGFTAEQPCFHPHSQEGKSPPRRFLTWGSLWRGEEPSLTHYRSLPLKVLTGSPGPQPTAPQPEQQSVGGKNIPLDPSPAVRTGPMSRGRDFQAEAAARVKAGSKDRVARLTERAGEESRENRMETRWDGAVGHGPNFAFYSEQDGGHRSLEPKTNVILTDVLFKRRRKLLRLPGPGESEVGALLPPEYRPPPRGEGGGDSSTQLQAAEAPSLSPRANGGGGGLRRGRSQYKLPGKPLIGSASCQDHWDCLPWVTWPTPVPKKGSTGIGCPYGP
ncbi:uncharacterized protein LOC144614114 [Panthera onca]